MSGSTLHSVDAAAGTFLPPCRPAARRRRRARALCARAIRARRLRADWRLRARFRAARRRRTHTLRAGAVRARRIHAHVLGEPGRRDVSPLARRK
eukprot:7378879-Prymnesium_polylepis.1